VRDRRNQDLRARRKVELGKEQVKSRSNRTASQTLAARRPTARLGVKIADRLRTDAPRLTNALAVGEPLMSNTQSILTRAEPMLACLRPYTPEAAGVAVLWGSWTKNYDPTLAGGRLHASRDHYARVLVTASPTSLHAYPKGTSTQIQEALGKKYAMPRPPGLGVERPWFLPQCGVTQAALDPTKDPEHPR